MYLCLSNLPLPFTIVLKVRKQTWTIITKDCPLCFEKKPPQVFIIPRENEPAFQKRSYKYPAKKSWKHLTPTEWAWSQVAVVGHLKTLQSWSALEILANIFNRKLDPTHQRDVPGSNLMFEPRGRSAPLGDWHSLTVKGATGNACKIHTLYRFAVGKRQRWDRLAFKKAGMCHTVRNVQCSPLCCQTNMNYCCSKVAGSAWHSEYWS